MPRVPGSKAQKVYSGAGSSQELISDRACLLKKVHLVLYYFVKPVHITVQSANILQYNYCPLGPYLFSFRPSCTYSEIYQLTLELHLQSRGSDCSTGTQQVITAGSNGDVGM